jgi:hypothetical protein
MFSPLFAFQRWSAATVDKAAFHYVTNCTFATVGASFNITACCLLPSTGQSLEVAMRCDLLMDNTAEHRQPQLFATYCCELDYSYEKYGMKLVVVWRKEQWRRIPMATSRPCAAITVFLPCTSFIIKEANGEIVMFNAYLLQLGIYNLLCGQTKSVPSNCVVNIGCEIQYINQQIHSTSNIKLFVSQKIQSILLVWNFEVMLEIFSQKQH